VKNYPASLPFGWLKAIVNYPAKLECTIYVHKLERAAAVSLLNREVLNLQTEQLARELAGKPPAATLENAYQSTVALRSAIAARETNLFFVSLYITLRAASTDELDKHTAAVLKELKAHILTPQLPTYLQEQAYRSAALPLGTDLLQQKYTMDTRALAAAFPFLNPHHIRSGIFYGINEHNGTPVILDRFRLQSYNAAIFGMTGSGKSYFAKLELLRYLMRFVELEAFIIDPLGEFRALTDALDGQLVRLGSTDEEAAALNPLDMAPDGCLHAKVEFAKTFLSSALTQHTPYQLAILDTVLLRLYKHRGTPLLADLQAELLKFNSKDAEHIACLLEPYVHGSLSFLNRTTEVNLQKPLICFDLTELPELQFPALMLLVLKFIYERVRRTLKRTLVLIDEAWNLFQQPATARAVANFTRHARHYNCGLTLISQTAEDFLNLSHGRVVLKNCALVALLRHEHVGTKMIEFFNLQPWEVQFLRTAKTGSNCRYAECLLHAGVAATARIPLQVLASSQEHKLATTHPEELQALQQAAEADGEVEWFEE
jgi:type IV secretory pathway VirB4 component